MIGRIFKFRKIISNRDTCRTLVDSDHPVYIDRKVEETADYRLYEGHFHSPLVKYLPDLVPTESHIARFQLMLPTAWSSTTTKKQQSQLRPLCIQLAGTGDHVSPTIFWYFVLYFGPLYFGLSYSKSIFGVDVILWRNRCCAIME